MVQKLHTLLAGFSSACKQKGTHRCKAPTLAIGYESICGSLATPSRTWRALALHPAVLSRKLHGTGDAYVTQQEIKRIITLLAEWRALSTRNEVLSLLELAYMSSRSFSEEEWTSPPLSELDPDAAPAASPASTLPPSSASFSPGV